jgi:hypothetical protein
MVTLVRLCGNWVGSWLLVLVPAARGSELAYELPEDLIVSLSSRHIMASSSQLVEDIF